MTATIEIDRRGSTGSGETASKKWIIGLTRAQLQSELEAIGVPERQSRMRASQLWQWLYNRGATSFNEMTNISKDLRARFEEHFRISRLDIVTEQISS
jgi:23S rRNA (adenine2503-C2)-methyltransferase